MENFEYMEVLKATHNDGQFILESIFKNSYVHFNSEFREEQGQLALRNQIETIINTGLCPVNTGNVKAEINVVRNSGATIGFLWLMHWSENETEIYISVVEASSRRKGIAKYLIEDSLSSVSPDHIVFARLKRKSKGMAKLLKLINFSSPMLQNPFSARRYTLVCS